MIGDEAQLIQRLKSGEASAFKELVENYQRRVFALAYDMTGNVQDAEDLSQETFIRVFHGIHKFRGDSQLSSWIYRIVVNLGINRRRKKSLSEMELRERFEDQNHPGNTIASSEHDPERATEAALLRARLRQALERLSEKQRTIFMLRHDHDLSVNAISEIMRISEGTVKSQLFRALRKLQKELAFYKADLMPE